MASLGRSRPDWHIGVLFYQSCETTSEVTPSWPWEGMVHEEEQPGEPTSKDGGGKAGMQANSKLPPSKSATKIHSQISCPKWALEYNPPIKAIAAQHQALLCRRECQAHDRRTSAFQSQITDLDVGRYGLDGDLGGGGRLLEGVDTLVTEALHASSAYANFPMIFVRLFCSPGRSGVEFGDHDEGRQEDMWINKMGINWPHSYTPFFRKQNTVCRLQEYIGRFRSILRARELPGTATTTWPGSPGNDKGTSTFPRLHYRINTRFLVAIPSS
ncbi:hypothetical protein F5148DRAFT_1150136 [Russula earlei]|uniref:Uncharacterized protein n=1 Tax=Russula earlei TaxID=71964 RepID=A0ACC0U6Z1_9AGAM|nr:hypothetical protein F5148DRAFT_1150136 [Russula earlei]